MDISSSLIFLFGDYARITGASIVALALTSIIFRILWELR